MWCGDGCCGWAYQVTFVRNVTDIDDKILDKAAAAGQQWWARAYFYEREFTQAYDTLGVLPPTYEPRATGHMIDMIDLIRRIIDNGHGYVVYDADGKPTGNVYFDVASWPHYGELTHQKQGAAEADEAAAVADRMGPSVDAAGDDKYNPIDPADASPDKHDLARFRAVEGAEAHRPAGRALVDAVRRGPPRLAHRMLGHEPPVSGRHVRHPRRRTGPALPRSRERDGADACRRIRARPHAGCIRRG